MKISTLTHYAKQWGTHVATSLTLCLTSMSSMAALPTMEAPSKGEGSGLFETLKNYGYDFILYAFLLISAIGFAVVATSALQTFREVRAGKKEWTDFAMFCGVGVILLVLVVWLGTKAIDILN